MGRNIRRLHRLRRVGRERHDGIRLPDAGGDPAIAGVVPAIAGVVPAIAGGDRATARIDLATVGSDPATVRVDLDTVGSDTAKVRSDTATVRSVLAKVRSVLAKVRSVPAKVRSVPAKVRSVPASGGTVATLCQYSVESVESADYCPGCSSDTDSAEGSVAICQVFRVPTLVGLFSRRKSPAEAGTSERLFPKLRHHLAEVTVDMRLLKHLDSISFCACFTRESPALFPPA